MGSIEKETIDSPPSRSVDFFGQFLWNQPANTQCLSFSSATSSTIGKPIPLSWNPSDSQPLPFVPAKFSSFSGAEYPFIVSETMGTCSIASKAISGSQLQQIDPNKTDSFKDFSTLIEYNSNEVSEPEFGGDACEESHNSSKLGLASKKRKRSNLEKELHQAQAAGKDDTENKHKADKSSSKMASTKPSGMNAKDSGETPKEDYIHVRARRGQATNSHSLAERVRREKISERMKLLQDLVPGCSKVTGKAVMLDEIINYVQSLQLQVEFLSLKLAALNPRMDLHIENLLAKDLIYSRYGSSSAIGISPDLFHHQLNSHEGLIRDVIPGTVSTPDAFRRVLNVQQMPNSWDNELHDFVQMNFSNNLPVKMQDLNVVSKNSFPK